MTKVKFDKKQYSVRDFGCNLLKKVCFIPFSGNGQNICRKYELGQCPSGTAQEILKAHKAKTDEEKNTK